MPLAPEHSRTATVPSNPQGAYPCDARLGIGADELIPGTEMGMPGLTQSCMFAEGTRTVSW